MDDGGKVSKNIETRNTVLLFKEGAGGEGTGSASWISIPEKNETEQKQTNKQKFTKTVCK